MGTASFLFPIAVILAVGALLYGRALFFGFLNYDDTPLLVEQFMRVSDFGHALASFHRDAFALLGPDSRGVYYRPVLWLSYLVDARIGGTRPAVYHATNLLLHLAACTLAYVLLRRFGSGWRTALLLALVLLVHPALASVVGWIPCRNDTLLALFAMTAALALLSFLERPGLARGVAVAASTALALFTKESGLALLAVLPAQAVVLRGPAVLRSRPLQLLGVGIGSVALGFVLLRRHALGAFPVGTSNALGDPIDTLARLVVYIGKTLLPVQLAVQPHLPDSSLVPGVVALGVVAVALFAMRARLTPRFAFGCFWYLAFLAPALLTAKEMQGLEHRLYVPLIGLLIAAASLRPGTWPLPRPLLQGGALVLLALLAAQTARRLPDYASDIAFWESASRSAPHSEPVWRTLAFRYFENGRLAEAVAGARRAIALNGDEAKGHLVLGIALARQGRSAEANEELRAATRLDPDNADAWANLSQLQLLMGDREGSARSRKLADEAAARAAAR
ncbi:MAG TPA: tetratricopeptide repeat protein [Myxococcota bacterium]|nr:tetratricopeptide repeat protein [Myxococcota bacterium]